MDRVERTTNLQMNGGLNCAQALLTTFGEPYGVTPETARMLGRPWNGGISQQAGTCGYLTGAVLVLAMALNGPDEATARKKVGDAVRELFKRFELRRGSTQCKNLLGADMSTTEGMRRITEEKLVHRICCNRDGVGRDAAEILEELLADRGKE